jgi:hypothetical protein
MKQLVVVVFFALSLFAGVGTKADNPLPQCDPCPFVR